MEARLTTRTATVSILAAVNSALQAAEELAKSKLNLGSLGDLGLGF